MFCKKRKLPSQFCDIGNVLKCSRNTYFLILFLWVKILVAHLIVGERDVKKLVALGCKITAQHYFNTK